MSNSIKHIVKRGSHTELYDAKKLYASVFHSCLAVREHDGTAELIAQQVVKDFEKWLERKSEITSADIRRVASQHLHAYNQDAAYIYKRHRDIS